MLANVQEGLGRFDEAENAYQQSIAHDPSNGVAYLRYGQLLIHLGRTDEAATLLNRATQLAPYLWQPHRDLGQIAIDRGDREEAIRHYRNALRVRADSPPEILLRELAEIETSEVGSS